MEAARRHYWRLEAALVALIVLLAILSLMVGPAGLTPKAAIGGLMTRDRPDHRARHPPARSAAADRRNARPLRRRCKACCATRWPSPRCSARRRPRRRVLVRDRVLHRRRNLAAVPLAGIAGALVSIGGLVATPPAREPHRDAARRLALASFAGAMTALILNLAPNPFAALEIAFWLLGSLEDRSTDPSSSPRRFRRELAAAGVNARVPRADAGRTPPPHRRRSGPRAHDGGGRGRCRGRAAVAVAARSGS
jgi:iron complex transport system permease protein